METLMKAALGVIIAVLALPGLATAQGRPPGDEDGWSLGAAIIAADSPYVGEGSRVLPVPSFGYDGERFSLRGLTGAFHLVDSGVFQLDLLASARLDGFDIALVAYGTLGHQAASQATAQFLRYMLSMILQANALH